MRPPRRRLTARRADLARQDAADYAQQVLSRLWVWIRGQGLIWLAGIILIAAGIICLYLSDKVVTGWWQGTLDAFGVGFIIAGIVDVLAISGLNQALTGQQNRREYERQAQQIILQVDLLNPDTQAQRAQDLLDRSGDKLDEPTRAMLRDVVRRGRLPPPSPAA